MKKKKKKNKKKEEEEKAEEEEEEAIPSWFTADPNNGISPFGEPPRAWSLS
jgi:hypothetical protein